MRQLPYFIFFIALSVVFSPAYCQTSQDQKPAFRFEETLTIPATAVKDQNRTGTCWSFATLSLLESEMLREKKMVADLSPMFIVYHTYMEKAQRYVRMHGHNNFDAGGIFHDVTNMIRKYGIVPDEIYRGLNYGEEKHVHGEMDQLLKNQVEAVVKNQNRKLTPVWQESVEATLNSYLGEIPETFEYQGVSYTPLSFARDFVGLNMDDYVEITSFSHHPYYSRFALEIPDNWSWDEVYNVPLEELEEIMDHALTSGFSVAWASDVSEKGFMSGFKGVALVPDVNLAEMSDAEIRKWEKLDESEREDELYKIDGPVHEKKITGEIRQLAFDNFQTTDDHGMHIIGIARDQEGNLYYKVKNSWGDYNQWGGHFYASKAYFNYKTTLIMLNRNAIPVHIRLKLGL